MPEIIEGFVLGFSLIMFISAIGLGIYTRYIRKATAIQIINQSDLRIDWEKDSLLLDTMITRKINPVIKFYIEIFSDQKNEKDMIHDTELDELYNNTTNDIYNALSPIYISYLESKYLGENKVLEYITEETYYLLSVAAIGRNMSKVDQLVVAKRANLIQSLNER